MNHTMCLTQRSQFRGLRAVAPVSPENASLGSAAVHGDCSALEAGAWLESGGRTREADVVLAEKIAGTLAPAPVNAYTPTKQIR